MGRKPGTWVRHHFSSALARLWHLTSDQELNPHRVPPTAWEPKDSASPPPPPPVPSQSSSLHRGERGAAFGPPSCGRDGGGDSHLLTSSLRPQGEGAPALCPLPCPHIQPLLLPAPEVLRLLNPPTPSLTNHLPPLPHGAELGLGLSSAVALDLPCDLGRPLGALRLTLREGHVSGDPEQKGRHRLKCSATGDNP